MSTLGYLEDIQFRVNSIKLLTFKDLSKQKTAKFHHHEIIGKKALSEFLGQDLEKLTFTIDLFEGLTVSVKEQLEILDGYHREGQPLEFVVGTSSFGLDKWVITDLSESYNQIYRNGAITQVSVDISLEEYISDVNLMPKIDATSKSLLKKGIGYYCKTKNVAKTALSGGYNSMVRAEAMDVLLNQINL